MFTITFWETVICHVLKSVWREGFFPIRCLKFFISLQAIMNASHVIIELFNHISILHPEGFFSHTLFEIFSPSSNHEHVTCNHSNVQSHFHLTSQGIFSHRLLEILYVPSSNHERVIDLKMTSHYIFIIYPKGFHFCLLFEIKISLQVSLGIIHTVHTQEFLRCFVGYVFPSNI